MVGINGISVRPHLINLQADGLVISQEQRHGVGRPRYIYRLSKKGIEKFPTNYMNLTAHLLEALEAELPKDKLDQIYTRMGDEMAKRHPLPGNPQTLEEQLTALNTLLKPEGFQLKWEIKGNKLTMYNHGCPYHHVGLSHPDICKIDEIMFNNILKRDLVLEECMLTGDKVCKYVAEV